MAKQGDFLTRKRVNFAFEFYMFSLLRIVFLTECIEEKYDFI